MHLIYCASGLFYFSRSRARDRTLWIVDFILFSHRFIALLRKLRSDCSPLKSAAHHCLNHPVLYIFCPPLGNEQKNGGERGIRTLGELPLGGFQDRCLKPLDHFSAKCFHLKYHRFADFTNWSGKNYIKIRNYLINSKKNRATSR